ncbi:aspartic proteinase-like [Hordeum vulgare]|nr:aspartic proteinase-like [Hordeum vulgare]
MLVAQTRPHKVCSQIGLCVFDGSHSVSNQIEYVINKKEKRGSDLLCTACEMTVVWIQNQLRKNQTEELILQYANQGPEIRTGFLKDDKPIKLNQGQEITISTDYTIKGDETMISMSYQKLAIDVKPGSTILYYQKLERVSASQRVDEAEDDENARMHMLRLAKSLLLLPCLSWIEFVTVSFSNTKQWVARPGLDFAEDPRLASPSGCVVGPENPSNPGVVGPEKHHVGFKFAGGRSFEFAGGRRTYVELSNNDGYTSDASSCSSELLGSHSYGGNCFY